MRRHVLLATALALLATTAWAMPAPAASPSGVSISAPGSVQRGMVTAITVTLPAAVAAVDGRVLYQGKSVEVLGVAPLGGGTGIRPVAFKGGGGASFGAYGLKPTSGKVRLQLVLVPRQSGRLSVRVVIDSTAGRYGKRLTVGTGADVVAGLAVGRSARRRPAPSASADGIRPSQVAGPAAELTPDGRFNVRDLDTARLEWSSARERGRVCGTDKGDVNGDGCTDIVDVQATKANQGRRTTFERPRVVKPKRIRANGVPVVRTFIVTSTADTADAAPGDGVCADSQSRCTLRAAMAEADYLAGDDRIEFDLPGSAPVTIQLSSRLPMITSRNGSVVIDAYSQKGASPNTASTGSNAIPGVELRGNGSKAREVGFRITSSGNTIRGFALRDLWRGMLLDGPNAKDNRIVGNWIGYTGGGNRQGSSGQYGIVINQGANNNRIGTSAEADRNVIGNWGTGVDLYGPGVDFNLIQNNLFCITPSGDTATCSTAIDHNFGPKSNTIGGDASERNIIGPTLLQGIELSHGWDPSLPYGTDTATTYQVNHNKVTGNWVGFRADGSYSAAYRSGQNLSYADNGNAINCYDGSNDNIIQRNYVASVYDGIQLETKNAVRNIVRGNVIGESPQGQNAPLTGWGIVVRWGTTNDTVSNNVIRNAAKGGIGLLKTNNSGAAQAQAYNIRISRNIVTDTSGIAIDLFGTNGPDPNDPGDKDKGANTLLNSPVVTYADAGFVRGTASKGATVEVFRASRAAGANGLPVEFLGDTVADGSGAWSMNLSGVSAGDRITTLQIRPDNNTSELSPNVALRQAPGAGSVVGEDAFSREVASGWGEADQGGTWNAPSQFSVTGSEGRAPIAAGTTRQARLGVGTADVTVTGRLSVDRLPVGGNTFGYLLVRANATTAYRGAIKVTPGGNVLVSLKRVRESIESTLASETPTGIVLVPGANLRYRFEAVGNKLRLRVWEGGTSEPADWNVTTSDDGNGLAGAVGFAGYAGKGVSNGPVVWSFDDLSVQRAS